MNRLLFIGASGMLGKPVAKELIKAGISVTLLARDVNKMKQLFPGVDIVKGDVMDKASLEKAFTGHQTAYLNLSITQSAKKNEPQPEREGVKNIIEAAQAAGIKRIGYLSSLIKNYQGMNRFKWWSFEIKNNAIDMIRSSGIPYSIFYPSTFMETIDHQMMQGNKLYLVGRSKAPMWFIAAEDYGRQVVKAFEIAGKANQEYIIQGTDAYTFGEAARIFKDHYKNPLKIMKAPIVVVKFLGMFVQKINYGYHICEALNNYPEKFESEKAWADLGKPSISLAQYASSL
jgi:uncharacterized protein YbjT (DUF2867 family)